MKVTLTNGKTYDLYPKDLIGSGGEAEIFKIYPDHVFKYYKPPTHPDFQGSPADQTAAKYRIQEHQIKLYQFPKGLPSQIITPVHIGLSRYKVVGYVMKMIKQAEPLLRYSEKSFRVKTNADSLIHSAIEKLHDTVKTLHTRQIVIGDFTDLNVLIQNNGALFIIDAVLLSILLDDSSSMSPNEAVAIDGFNHVIEALRQSKQQDGILVQTWLLNSGVVHPFIDLMSVPTMDTSVYKTYGMTPLYKRTLEILSTAVAKQQELENAGVPSRSITFVVTDGGDNNSNSITKWDVKTFVTDLLTDRATVEKHIIGGMGIDDGLTDFVDVFKGMGIEDSWILTPSNNHGEIRKAFEVFSQSAVRASQSAQGFSQTVGAGFTS